MSMFSVSSIGLTFFKYLVSGDSSSRKKHECMLTNVFYIINSNYHSYV